jgi:hypothetical protein
MTWDELKATFASSIAASYEATIGRVSAASQATPAAFEAKVTTFFALLAKCKANLDRIQVRLPHPRRTHADAAIAARYAEMKSLYELLGISRNAVQVPQVGVAPAVVIVLGSVGLFVASVAWAVTASSTPPRCATRPPAWCKSGRPACRSASAARSSSRRRRPRPRRPLGAVEPCATTTSRVACGCGCWASAPPLPPSSPPNVRGKGRAVAEKLRLKILGANEDVPCLLLA